MISKLQKKPSALKENIQHFKAWNFLIFLWVIFALLDPDPDTWIWIQFGYGLEALVAALVSKHKGRVSSASEREKEDWKIKSFEKNILPNTVICREVPYHYKWTITVPWYLS